MEMLREEEIDLILLLEAERRMNEHQSSDLVSHEVILRNLKISPKELDGDVEIE